uniref:Uncharacterized protein n=1 Tax=Setaria italica TaxID=4555 RepID=K3XNS7_SETIT
MIHGGRSFPYMSNLTFDGLWWWEFPVHVQSTVHGGESFQVCTYFHYIFTHFDEHAVLYTDGPEPKKLGLLKKTNLAEAPWIIVYG